jgi:hypothetical protein
MTKGQLPQSRVREEIGFFLRKKLLTFFSPPLLRKLRTKEKHFLKDSMFPRLMCILMNSIGEEIRWSIYPQIWERKPEKEADHFFKTKTLTQNSWIFGCSYGLW